MFAVLSRVKAASAPSSPREADCAANRLHFCPNIFMQSGCYHRRKKKWNSFNSFDVPKSYIAQSTLHHELLPPLSSVSENTPQSNDLHFDKALAPYLSTPRQAKVYLFDKPVVIEPASGQLYLDGRMVRESFIYFAPPKHKSKEFLKSHLILRSQDTQRIKSAISLNLQYDRNYFHTLHDLMTRIAWIEMLGIANDVPVIISERWSNSSIGRQLLKSPLLASRKIVVQADGQPIVCENLYLVHPPQNDRTTMDMVTSGIAAQAPLARTGKKIVLIRKSGKRNPRKIVGYNELVKILCRNGFDQVDPATLSIAEQKWVFERAEHVVGENGAGFVNIAFCRSRNVKIDAITANKHATPTFQCFAQGLGFIHRTELIPSVTTDSGIQGHIPPISRDRILQSALG